MGGKKKKSKGGASPSQQNQQRERSGVGAAAAAAAPVPPTTLPIMECDICKEKYDMGEHKPRNLRCGHSFCTLCCKRLANGKSIIICPRCRSKTPIEDSVDDLPVNYPVLDLLNSPDDKPTESQKSSPLSSPHGGRCLEAGAPIYEYCSHCHLWLCKECSSIDHSGPECCRRPYKDTLRNMHMAAGNKAWATVNSLKKFTREADDYDMKLKSFATLMEIALECVKKEQHHLLEIKSHSQKLVREMRDAPKKLLSDHVEEALFFINGVEETASVTQKWEEDSSSFLQRDQLFRLLKPLLQTAIQMHMKHSTETSGGVVILHSIDDKDVLLPMEIDKGRLLVHAATDPNAVPNRGCRVLKFELLKSCIDPAHALTFLDLSVMGRKIGRMFIRLLDRTKRSQCFLLMCTGETGPSFINTRFHRFWWSNKAGEHMWGGDFDRGNGSGGTIPLGILHEISELPEKKTKLPITRGLVAGRHEKYTSTIFRIYTKGSEEMEEAAFGRVEYGLHVLKEALEVNQCITDITISACGMVVEP